MWKLSSACIALVALVIFDVIPHRSLSTPLIRHLRSPNTTPESHISNFLHQHRSDSRADKPEEHSVNASDPVHHAPAHPKPTTTEAPVSQTELLVSLIHNTIQTVREQFPSLISAISAPKEEPKPPTRSKKEHRKKEHHSNHNTHAHSMQERSANSTSQEEETDGSGSGSQESGEDEEFIDEQEENGDFPADNNSASLIPPALLKTILEASGSSSARGSAGASAGSAASASAGAASSSSNPSGRTARQADEENQGSASGEFVFAILRHKLQAIGSVLFAPFLSASTFVQRSIGSASMASGGGSVPGTSGTEPHDEHGHHDHRHSDHNHDHHHSDSHDHRSDGSGHHSGGHGHHSSEHGHHSGEHGHHSGDHGSNHQHNTTVDESANLIFGVGDPRDNSHKLYYRDASTKNANATLLTNSTNTMITDELVSQEASSYEDGPLRIVLANGFLEYNDTNNRQNSIVRKRREARMFFDERIGIYILEFFGSIAGLTWGAVHQVTHLFQSRSDDDLEDFFR